MKDWKNIYRFTKSEALRYGDGDYWNPRENIHYAPSNMGRRLGNNWLCIQRKNMFTTKKIVYKLLEYEDI